MPVLLWSVHYLKGLVTTIAIWVKHWSGAHLVTGRPQELVLVFLVLGVLPWLPGVGACSRRWQLFPRLRGHFRRSRIQVPT